MSDIKLTEETLQPTPVMNDNFKNTDWRGDSTGEDRQE